MNTNLNPIEVVADQLARAIASKFDNRKPVWRVPRAKRRIAPVTWRRVRLAAAHLSE